MMSAPLVPTPLPLRNSYWVLPGLLLAGEHPEGSNRDRTRERLKKLLGAGIRCFVDLTRPTEMQRYDLHLPRDVEYVRNAVKDHGVPASPGQMIEILDCILNSLQGRRPVYIHCRAGIGRTGTVAGCILVERGLSGEAALDELNRLWQQSRRSRSWSVVPETDQQASFIRSWVPRLPDLASVPIGIAAEAPAGPEPIRARAAREARLRDRAPAPVPAPAVVRAGAVQAAALAEVAPGDPLFDPETLSAARGLRERFLGALLGLAVGDAVAAATQFRKPGSFTPVGDMLGGGPFELPRGAWSDDTAMALCLAESLLERNGFDARDQVQRYSRWQKDGYLTSTGQCVGITASTTRALAMARWRRHLFTGSHDPEQLDPEPLSRVVSVVLFFLASLETTVQQAADSSRTTCQAPGVLDACRRLAQTLHLAVRGHPKESILAEIPVAQPTEVSTSAPAALAAAMWAFSSTNNFRDAVLRAANLGGNSDVVAAVCGQLAGAHYGASAIPSTWRNGLMQKDLIEGFADRLLTHALVSLGS